MALESIIKQFQYYKSLGAKTFDQLSDEDLFWKSDSEANSIAVIVNHLNGNMLSRWTDFLNSDGEKEWRTRDAEFEEKITNRAQLHEKWEEGWNCLFEAITPLSPADLERTVYIRNMGHTVLEALLRQLAHYAYHVGQIVHLGRQLKGPEWQSLSIPKGKSTEYNKAKFSKGKRKQHFTDDFLKEDK